MDVYNQSKPLQKNRAMGNNSTTERSPDGLIVSRGLYVSPDHPFALCSDTVTNLEQPLNTIRFGRGEDPVIGHVIWRGC